MLDCLNKYPVTVTVTVTVTVSVGASEYASCTASNIVPFFGLAARHMFFVARKSLQQTLHVLIDSSVEC
jgi:hypothetical protein